ncbi:hypothetical protein [Streptomyces radicis]|uniref:Uncharacterized protein n=1 Tax=Streptomyces radicis TaxID=1750517 RepID=A0A3A9VWH6_9ACTN|nr:hypothetical protein [Streptomyces radicis]RKN05110.1 hypothetical protein D7319_26450 [Streptomyces radicis]RKN16436.1 hypothetical protein D7318_25815 [Streptomyces radicis]
MPDPQALLSVHALGAAVRPDGGHRPVAALERVAHARALGDLVAAARGVPAERLRLLPPGRTGGVAVQALAALGPPPDEQPLYLVRSGPLRDPRVAELARLVHTVGWDGEDIGVTHLDELGGALVFDLLSWAMPAAATALICDEPSFTESPNAVPLRAVSLRVRRGPGPLRVLGCGEGAPPPAAGRRFTGAGPCDAWLALRDAVGGGELTSGDRVLLHTRGPEREGWLVLEATSPAALHLPPGAERGEAGES